MHSSQAHLCFWEPRHTPVPRTLVEEAPDTPDSRAGRGMPPGAQQGSSGMVLAQDQVDTLEWGSPEVGKPEVDNPEVDNPEMGSQER